MACPRNEYGQTLCHVTDHPDRPYESFCTTCQRRFRKEEGSLSSVAPVLALLALLLALLFNRGTASRTPAPNSLEPVNAIPESTVTIIEESGPSS